MYIHDVLRTVGSSLQLRNEHSNRSSHKLLQTISKKLKAGALLLLLALLSGCATNQARFIHGELYVSPSHRHELSLDYKKIYQYQIYFDDDFNVIAKLSRSKSTGRKHR